MEEREVGKAQGRSLEFPLRRGLGGCRRRKAKGGRQKAKGKRQKAKGQDKCNYQFLTYFYKFKYFNGNGSDK